MCLALRASGLPVRVNLHSRMTQFALEFSISPLPLVIFDRAGLHCALFITDSPRLGWFAPRAVHFCMCSVIRVVASAP